jgi:methionyl aminopeptidase
MFLKKRKVIKLKVAKEISRMRTAGRVVGEILEKLSDIIKAGITTKDIDDFSEKYIRSLKMIPAFLGVQGRGSPFPASTCVSINDEVVHGIPSVSRVLKSGDIVSVDVGVLYKGYYGDAARTYAVGSISSTAAKLLEITELSLKKGIEQALAGNKVGDISSAVQRTVESAGFSIVRDFVGHGIGKALHEEPQIPNYGKSGTGVELVPGMAFAIEPMVNAGNYEVYISNDDWTAVTMDGSLSAHFEHTIVITKNGYEILTKV